MLFPQEPEWVPYTRIKVLFGASAVAILLASGASAGVAWLTGGRAAHNDTREAAAPPADAHINTSPFGTSREPLAAPNDYRWVDRERRIVAIPIDVAIDIYVETHRTEAGR